MRLLHKILLFICLPIVSFAQNYRCIDPNTKRYFINSNFYLRGIRIDSVKTIGSDTIQYPFKSFRGKADISIKLDTNGGSWLGSKILLKPNGDTYFFNNWSDTLLIKTQAQIHDSWILYNDTSSNYYTAEITNVDTSTILGTLDTIKTITLTSKNQFGVNPSNTLNNLQIKISSNHGIIQAIDFYLFPYYKQGSDFLLDRTTSSPYSTNLLFNICNFDNPDYLDFYNYNKGDIFLIEKDLLGNPKHLYTILDKITVSTTHIRYVLSSWRQVMTSQFGPRVTSGSIDTLDYYSSPFLDKYMPEEWRSFDFYYYNPNDTSFCTTGLYWTKSNNVTYPGGSVNTFEPAGSDYKYKKGLGFIYHYYYNGGGPYYYTETLTSVYKGFSCGPMPILNVEQNSQSNKLDIYPNPANETLTIETSAGTKISLISLTGQTIKTVISENEKTDLNIEDINPGLYYIQLTDKVGNVKTTKISINH